MDISCEECANFVFDDDEEDYVCCVSMDEDDYIRLNTDSHYQCPYYQCGDEYKVVRHQMQKKQHPNVRKQGVQFLCEKE